MRCKLPAICWITTCSMSKELLQQPDIQAFIRQYQQHEPAALRLRFAKQHPDWPWPAILNQIKARQKAATKLPDWYATPGILFPDPLAVEQASSQATARFKATVVASGSRALDLTGGLGADSASLSQRFAQVDYVEIDEQRAALAQHNFQALGLKNIKVYQQDAEQFLQQTTTPYDLIYLDPDRRPDKQRVSALAHSRPNVLALLPRLLQTGRQVLIKTAPLLDISATASQLPNLLQVGVVALQNEVKEVLYLLQAGYEDKYSIRCVELHKKRRYDFKFKLEEEIQEEIKISDISNYLYMPGAAVLKAGAFKLAGSRFGLYKLHANTHLYTADKHVAGFPGQVFKVLGTAAYRKKTVQALLPSRQANISVRNFPDSPEQVKKTLGLRDGGKLYLFAYRNAAGRPEIAVTEKVEDRLS
ncbi:MAG TPA: methyltransferase domain-containing protein [Flammeovirgaceae bacterium]|nr:methyltransferase domain-containing protein [Flammeovirgaceae bacterium]